MYIRAVVDKTKEQKGELIKASSNVKALIDRVNATLVIMDKQVKEITKAFPKVQAKALPKNAPKAPTKQELIGHINASSLTYEEKIKAITKIRFSAGGTK